MTDYNASHPPKYYNELKREHKEAIGLLSIGTFLEYFDLMLYVHMAVLLNELFFPKTDPYTEQILAAFAFCSTYVLRPFGALIFGYIGDTIGRKATVIITTFMMSISCIIMATLPTYAQIGIAAAWIVTICRIMQGMASMGEIIGAELYLTEVTRPPVQYPIVSIIAISSILGTSSALAIAALVTSHGFNWRIAFVIGALVALIGTVARTSLRETPVFADAKRRVQSAFEKANRSADIITSNKMYSEKTSSFKTALAFFLLQSGYPPCFYLVYIYCGNFLKQNFDFTAAQVIQQNLMVSFVYLFNCLVITFLSYKMAPLRILKFKTIMFSLIAVSLPYLFTHATSSFDVMMIQCAIMICILSCTPAIPVFLRNFPVFRRFTYGTMVYALSRSVMSAITSIGLVYLINELGIWGLLILLVPVVSGFWLSILHFEQLEEKRFISVT